ncbi:hypothetical protein C0995_012880 [Termitomyces sp. Mi166|nr:hypothetical protein C0995_012880 [Termitomyces sp. Mi166\
MRIRDSPPFDSVEMRVARSRAQSNAASAASEVDLLGTLTLINIIKFDIDAPRQLALENHTQETAETAKDKDLLSLLPFAQHSPALDTARRTSSSHSLLMPALRILIFLPWCPIAGASILLFPTHIERIIFGPGFVSSPQGIHRFAFWTDVSKELMGAFLGAVLVVWLYVAGDVLGSLREDDGFYI